MGQSCAEAAFLQGDVAHSFFVKSKIIAYNSLLSQALTYRILLSTIR